MTDLPRVLRLPRVLLVLVLAVPSAAQRPVAPGLPSDTRNLFALPPYAVPGLVCGAAFKDRILPMPIVGRVVEEGLWGADGVLPRDPANGIEHPDYSYWGGNVVRTDDGRYHQFVCRWREDDRRGHGAWQESEIVRAVSDSPTGPFVFEEVIGPGHNPEFLRLPNGRCIIYRIGDRFYEADRPEGPWREAAQPITLDHNDRKPERVDNPSVTLTPDGAILMVFRHGDIYRSESAPEGPFKKIAEGIYPEPDPDLYRYWEDPVIWRGPHQYHLIVNYWPACQAVYLRSLDGVHWVHEWGVAFDTSVVRHTDGTRVDWFKLERPKVLLDAHRRATHLYLAGIDVIKNLDRGSDRHSSKNVAMPLVKQRLLQLQSTDDGLKLAVLAEEGEADSLTQIDVESLRLGAFQEVNRGRGARALRSQLSEERLTVWFEGTGGLGSDNLAAKLLGRTHNGELVFGYAPLPSE